MARKVNSSPDGVSILDVDPNALSRERILDNAIGDTALVYDLVTGKNSPPATLDHSGPGNGCVLGLPMANQATDVYDVYVDEENSSYNQDTSLWQFIGPQPAGETTISMVMDFDRFPNRGGQWPQFEVLTLAYAQVGIAPIFGNNTAATVTGLTPGTVYVYRVTHRLIQALGWVHAENFTLGFFRPGSTNTIVRTPTDVRDSTELASQTVSSAVVLDHHDFDEAEQAEARAVSGYHATNLAHNQHALEEFITGAPAGTNQTRILTPSATQGAYYDHSRLGSEFSAMPLIQRFPVGGGSLGIAPVDGGTGEDGAGGWSEDVMTGCPGWSNAASATYKPLIYHDSWMPRHAANNLRFFVLAYSPDGTLGSLTTLGRLRVFNSISSAQIGSDATSATWTQIGSSKWFFWTVSGVDHLPEKSNSLYWDLKITAGGPKTNGGSLRIAAWSANLEG